MLEVLAVVVDGELDDGVEQRVSGSHKVCLGFALNVDVLALECDALIGMENRSA